MLPKYEYLLNKSVEIFGRQGVATDDEFYWISGSTSLAKYDSDWNEIIRNEDPFVDYDVEVNHIDDIDVYNSEVYISRILHGWCGQEYPGCHL